MVRIAIGVLAIMVCALGHFARQSPAPIWKGCPYVTYRVQGPSRVQVDEQGEDMAIGAAAVVASRTPLYINGKEMVTVREPSVEEWRKIDARAQFAAQIRKIDRYALL